MHGVGFSGRHGETRLDPAFIYSITGQNNNAKARRPTSQPQGLGRTGCSTSAAKTPANRTRGAAKIGIATAETRRGGRPAREEKTCSSPSAPQRATQTARRGRLPIRTKRAGGSCSSAARAWQQCAQCRRYTVHIKPAARMDVRFKFGRNQCTHKCCCPGRQPRYIRFHGVCACGVKILFLCFALLGTHYIEVCCGRTFTPRQFHYLGLTT